MCVGVMRVVVVVWFVVCGCGCGGGCGGGGGGSGVPLCDTSSSVKFGDSPVLTSVHIFFTTCRWCVTYYLPGMIFARIIRCLLPMNYVINAGASRPKTRVEMWCGGVFGMESGNFMDRYCGGLMLASPRDAL